MTRQMQVRYSENSDPDAPLLSLGQIELCMRVDIDFTDGQWVVSTDAPWGRIEATGEARTVALLRLIAVRCGEVLP
jgi:hypothetical protein